MRFYEGPSKDGLYSPPQTRIPALSSSFNPCLLSLPSANLPLTHTERIYMYVYIPRNTGIIAAEI